MTLDFLGFLWGGSLCWWFFTDFSVVNHQHFKNHHLGEDVWFTFSIRIVHKQIQVSHLWEALLMKCPQRVLNIHFWSCYQQYSQCWRELQYVTICQKNPWRFLVLLETSFVFLWHQALVQSLGNGGTCVCTYAG